VHCHKLLAEVPERDKTKGEKMRNTLLKTIGGVALAGSLVAAAMTFTAKTRSRLLFFNA
jgi:hypothetical protein